MKISTKAPSGMKSYDWWLERVQVAEDMGPREVRAGCPLCGSSDNLHIEERNGAAMVHCFSPGCSGNRAFYAELVESVERGAPEPTESDEPEEADVAPVISIRRRKRGESAVSQMVTLDPMDWAAQRCGMTRAELDSLELPMHATEDRFVFDFEGTGTTKSRGLGETKKEKDFRWVGGATPPFWPVPEQPPEEVIITEGEFDAVVLTLTQGEALGVYSITGGAGNVPDREAFGALRDLGVKTVRVVFDQDEAGRTGLAAVLEEIRAAGLQARPYRVTGLLPLLAEKDVRDVAKRIGAANITLEPDVDEDSAIPLSHVTAVPPAALWENYVHPTEHTVLYGDGGTGKGVVAAHWVSRLVRHGKRVLVVDYEAHAQHEWRPRIERFLEACDACSLTDQRARLDHVSIVQPTQAIWDVQDWLQDEVLRTRSELVVIDSVTYACVGVPAEDSTTAVKYTMATARLGVPVLSIAHVTKADANPRHPFGSIYWSNGARITVAVSRDGTAPDSPRLVKNWKSNQKHEEPDRHVDWSWLDAELPAGGLHFSSAVPTSKSGMVGVIIADLEAATGQRPLPENVLAEAVHRDWDVGDIKAVRTYVGRYYEKADKQGKVGGMANAALAGTARKRQRDAAREEPE